MTKFLTYTVIFIPENNSPVSWYLFTPYGLIFRNSLRAKIMDLFVCLFFKYSFLGISCAIGIEVTK